MNTTTRMRTAERFGRWLGRGWRGYVRGERRLAESRVAKDILSTSLRQIRCLPDGHAVAPVLVALCDCTARSSGGLSAVAGQTALA